MLGARFATVLLDASIVGRFLPPSATVRIVTDSIAGIVPVGALGPKITQQ